MKRELSPIERRNLKRAASLASGKYTVSGKQRCHYKPKPITLTRKQYEAEKEAERGREHED